MPGFRQKGCDPTGALWEGLLVPLPADFFLIRNSVSLMEIDPPPPAAASAHTNARAQRRVALSPPGKAPPGLVYVAAGRERFFSSSQSWENHQQTRKSPVAFGLTLRTEVCKEGGAPNSIAPLSGQPGYISSPQTPGLPCCLPATRLPYPASRLAQVGRLVGGEGGCEGAGAGLTWALLRQRRQVALGRPSPPRPAAAGRPSIWPSLSRRSAAEEPSAGGEEAQRRLSFSPRSPPPFPHLRSAPRAG